MSSYALGLIETKGLVGAIEACDAAAKAANVVVSSVEVTDGAYVSLKIEGDLGAVQASVDAGARAAEKVGELISVHVIARPDRGLTPITPPKRYVSKYHPEDDRPRVESDDVPRAPEPKKPAAKKAPVRKPVKAEPPPPKPEPPKAEQARPAPPPEPPKPEQAKPELPPEPPKPEPPPAAEPPKAEPPKTDEPTAGQVKLADLEAMPVVKLRRFARTIKDLPLKGRQISMANKTQLIDAIKSVWGLD